LANCCNPIPGDQVFGFVTVNDGIKVHKKNCPNALQLQSNYAYRIIPAKWIDSSQQDFKAVVKLTGIDNLGLVSEVTKEISSNLNVNMQKVSFESVDGVFSGQITLKVKNNAILTKIINRLKKINGIDKVSRE
jgi:GTP pyrophosphokinase